MTSNSSNVHDSAVMETAADASLCKLSASTLGYYRDPFVQFFVKSPSRRMPIINRGYYARVAAVETLVRKFVAASDAHTKTQVVVLGAGHDTMFFRLQEAGQLAHCTYFELDFPDVTRQKVAVMKRRKALAALVGLDSSDAFLAAVSSGASWLACRRLEANARHLTTVYSMLPLSCSMQDTRSSTRAATTSSHATCATWSRRRRSWRLQALTRGVWAYHWISVWPQELTFTD